MGSFLSEKKSYKNLIKILQKYILISKVLRGRKENKHKILFRKY